MDSSTAKVFQIGFNRCGTRFIHQYLVSLGYETANWDGGRLAMCMMENFKNGRRLLTGYDHVFRAFTDMEHLQSNTYAHRIFFKMLDEQYPGSKFILNTRDVEVWLQKRLTDDSYVREAMRYHGFHTIGELAMKWREEWMHHHEDVMSYFGERRSGNDLLVYDVDRDNPNKLFVFLSDPELVHGTFGRLYREFSSRFSNFLVTLPSRPDDDDDVRAWFDEHVLTYCACLPDRRPYMESLFERLGWTGKVWFFESLRPTDVERRDMERLSTVYALGMPQSPCPSCVMDEVWHPGLFDNPTKFCVHLSNAMCLHHGLEQSLFRPSMYTLVLEDDVRFEASSVTDVARVCFELVQHDDDVLYLGFGHCKRGQTLRRAQPSDRTILLPPHQQILCKHAILYKNSYLQRMFPYLFPQVDCSDVHFNHVNMRLNARVRIARPPIVFQDRDRFGSQNGNAQESRIPLYDFELSIEEEEAVHNNDDFI